MKLIDKEFIEQLEQIKVKYQVVMTKADLVTPVDLARRYTILQNALQPYKHAVSDILMVSSRTGGGLPKLRRVIQHVLQPTSRKDARLGVHAPITRVELQEAEVLDCRYVT